MKPFSWIGLALVAMALLAGCNVRPEFARPHVTDERAMLWVTPALMAPQGLQAIIDEYQASDIHRIEIVPYWMDNDYVNHPLSKVTGAPTATDDPEILKAVMSGEELALNRAIALSGLRRNQPYRIVAYAYSLAGELISSPPHSQAILQVGDDDRPRGPGVIPLYLSPVSFYGRQALDITLSDPGRKLDHLVVTVFRLWGTSPMPQGAPVVLRREDLPHVVTLLNLSAHATYQVELKARPADSAAPDLLVERVNWTMENEDAPATRSVMVSIP
jgi:hypothetical protein